MDEFLWSDFFDDDGIAWLLGKKQEWGSTYNGKPGG
jgi:hypothetical protein